MKMRRLLTRLCASVAIIVTLVFATVQLRYAPHIHTNIAELPRMPFAIVLGANIKKDGSPSSALQDRLDMGIELFKRGIVDRLLLTGDDGAYHVDEMSVMTKYVSDHGVPDERIVMDGHGYRTYESCKRAKNIYQISRAIIVTQRFHLGRALYLCNHLGVHAEGITADRVTYEKIIPYWLREIPASLKAWWDVNVMAPASPVSKSVL